ncbi:hypothetical protein SDC9_103030 [bioreactor metagenome]|uniref:Uncharacterized protein n=1 Tax=bioreactor metagenome TaxID=1076179 RepID=A0A645ATZ1_9ZZZZ
MGARYTYSVNYRYTCEKCGQQTGWLTHRKLAETPGLDTVLHATPGLRGIGAYLTYDEIRSTRETFTKQMAQEQFSLLEGGDACPHCGARQSWRPPYDFTNLTLPGSIALTTVGYFTLSAVLALIVFAIFAEDSIPAVIGLCAAGLIVGPMRAVTVRRKREKINRDFLSACTVFNKPEIDWASETIKAGWESAAPQKP